MDANERAGRGVELHPWRDCPFCGSKPEWLTRALAAHSDEALHAVVCGQCGARGPLSPSANLAVGRWTERNETLPSSPAIWVLLVLAIALLLGAAWVWPNAAQVLDLFRA